MTKQDMELIKNIDDAIQAEVKKFEAKGNTYFLNTRWKAYQHSSTVGSESVVHDMRLYVHLKKKLP